MKLDVKFSVKDQSFSPQFGEVHSISDGGYERGYAEGYEDGEVSGVNNFIGERPFVLTGTATTVADWGFQNIPAAFEIDLPYLTTFGGGAFYGCKKLTKVNCPLATKGNASTFYTCAKLTDVYLPKYQSVGSYEFYGCTSLEVLDLPLVKDLWSYAFSGCTNLKKLILRLPQGCALRELSAFNNTPIASGTGFIYVPDNLVEQYKAATNWSTYATQIKPLSELEGD